MRGTILAAVAVAGALASAGSASADAPNVGSTCGGDDLGKTATASDGTTIRCIADDTGRLSWFADTGAVGTLASLQAQGYTVTVDRVGDNPLETCVVTEVHNEMTTTQRVGSGGTTAGGTGSIGNRHKTTIPVTKTIDVSLDCTAPG
jgi:hypothetical protein